MIFFRETYHTKEFFFLGNDIVVRHVEKSIDFRGSEHEKDTSQWYKVKDKTTNLIKLSKDKSDELEKEYWENRNDESHKKNGSA